MPSDPAIDALLRTDPNPQVGMSARVADVERQVARLLVGRGPAGLPQATEVAWRGPWGTAAPPGSTSGQAFTIPADGTYQLTLNHSAYSTATGAFTTSIYVDGVVVVRTGMFVSTANVHAEVPRAVWRQTLTAGPHYVWLWWDRQSDANDQATLAAIRVAP